MSLTPSIVALTIAVTRIHRGLVDYASIECTKQYDVTLSYIVLFGAFDGSIVRVHPILPRSHNVVD